MSSISSTPARPVMTVLEPPQTKAEKANSSPLDKIVADEKSAHETTADATTSKKKNKNSQDLTLICVMEMVKNSNNKKIDITPQTSEHVREKRAQTQHTTKDNPTQQQSDSVFSRIKGSMSDFFSSTCQALSKKWNRMNFNHTHNR